MQRTTALSLENVQLLVCSWTGSQYRILSSNRSRALEITVKKRGGRLHWRSGIARLH